MTARTTTKSHGVSSAVKQIRKTCFSSAIDVMMHTTPIVSTWIISPKEIGTVLPALTSPPSISHGRPPLEDLASSSIRSFLRPRLEVVELVNLRDGDNYNSNNGIVHGLDFVIGLGNISTQMSAKMKNSVQYEVFHNVKKKNEYVG